MLKEILLFITIFTFTSFLQASDLTSPPDTSEGPVIVSVTMKLLDINEIEGASQSFNANVFFELEWVDKRLAHDGKSERKVKLDDIWHPNMEFANETFLRRTFPRIAYISPEGKVTFFQRMVGDFSQALVLNEFPFDVQTIELVLVAVDMIHGNYMQIKPLHDEAGYIGDSFSLPDWDIVRHSFSAIPYKPISTAVGSPAVSFKVIVNRKLGYYWLHIIIPLIFIVIMSMTIFWIPPHQQGVQVGISTTSMLTLIAYKFSISGNIPAVSYLTRLDIFILVSTVLVFFALIHSIVTAQMVDKGMEKLALKMDWVNRFLFPAVFIYTVLYILIVPRDEFDQANWSQLFSLLIG